jgi:hypothetical protein
MSYLWVKKPSLRHLRRGRAFLVLGKCSFINAKMLHPLIRNVTYGAGNDFELKQKDKEKKKGRRYWAALIDIVPMLAFTGLAIDNALAKQRFTLVNE